MISGNGNTKLSQLLLRLSQAEKNLGQELAKQLIPDTKRLVADSFRNQVSPDGVPWTPKKDGTALKLADLKGSISYQADAEGMTITVPPPASYHQEGTDRIPARPFLPKGNSLPPSWAKSYQQEVKKVMKRRLQGGGG